MPMSKTQFRLDTSPLSSMAGSGVCYSQFENRGTIHAQIRSLDVAQVETTAIPKKRGVQVSYLGVLVQSYDQPPPDLGILPPPKCKVIRSHSH